jgi:hypothetical protein
MRSARLLTTIAALWLSGFGLARAGDLPAPARAEEEIDALKLKLKQQQADSSARPGARLKSMSRRCRPSS